MRRYFAVGVVLLLSASPVAALDLPTRKAGLWELKMEFQGRNLPTQLMQQCTDAASDKLMNLNFGGVSERNCQKRDVRNTGGTITVDSVCTFGEATTTSHAVVSGDFNSAYTVQVNSTRQGGRPIPGAAPGGESHMTIAAKWLGPCVAGQKPGDVMMGNGMKMNVLDLQRMGGPPGRQ
ncbi:MAG TPA: DUF3617 family protein [Pseudolabrys sp.]|nr:DUF3617 family protein [Pseudolabrys sp.]